MLEARHLILLSCGVKDTTGTVIWGKGRETGSQKLGTQGRKRCEEAAQRFTVEWGDGKPPFPSRLIKS